MKSLSGFAFTTSIVLGMVPLLSDGVRNVPVWLRSKQTIVRSEVFSRMAIRMEPMATMGRMAI